MNDTLDIASYGMFLGIFLFVLTLMVLFSTGSLVAVFVLWVLIALIGMVLVFYGFVDVYPLLDKLAPEKAGKTQTEMPNEPSLKGSAFGNEVFHISQNQFTYDEASAVCAAHGATLATMEQVQDAYAAGAEWCGYGWTAGGMALFPTQEATWKELQREIDPARRAACGRPGVNGGYFDPNTKFGVNCFGTKPAGDFKPPAPVPGTDRAKFESMVNRFKAMLKSMNLSPWNRNAWSGVGTFQQDLQGLNKGAVSTAEATTTATPSAANV